MTHVRNGRTSVLARREAATIRLALREQRSAADQLDVLTSRPGNASRERARLTKEEEQD